MKYKKPTTEIMNKAVIEFNETIMHKRFGLISDHFDSVYYSQDDGAVHWVRFDDDGKEIDVFFIHAQQFLDMLTAIRLYNLEV